MIKRRFYREEHGDKDDPSSGSSSSSDSEVESEATQDSEEDLALATRDEELSCSVSSGYEREHSSEPESDGDTSEYINRCVETEESFRPRIASKSVAEVLHKESEDLDDIGSLPADLPDCVLKCNSVYKCRICPRIICLNLQTIKSHLNSKRHARSEKLLKENRLKLMLNSDGEIENQETPAELHARIVALAQEQPKKKQKGQRHQKKRRKENNAGDDSNKEKAPGSMNCTSKKRKKEVNLNQKKDGGNERLKRRSNQRVVSSNL